MTLTKAQLRRREKRRKQRKRAGVVADGILAATALAGLLGEVQRRIEQRERARAATHVRPPPKLSGMDRVKPILDGPERNAAERIITLWSTSNIAGRGVTARFGEAGGLGEMSERRAKAWRAYSEIMRAIGQPLAAAVTSVLCFDGDEPAELVKAGLGRAACHLGFKRLAAA